MTSRRMRLAPIVAPSLLLIGVAMAHFVLVHTVDLTPWKGGGFGMFSTVDAGGSRVLRVEAKTEFGAIPLRAPDFDDLAAAVRRLPSESLLTDYASGIANLAWFDTATPSNPTPPLRQRFRP